MNWKIWTRLLTSNLRHCPGICLGWNAEKYKIISKYEQCQGHIWRGNLTNTRHKLDNLRQNAWQISTITKMNKSVQIISPMLFQSVAGLHCPSKNVNWPFLTQQVYPLMTAELKCVCESGEILCFCERLNEVCKLQGTIFSHLFRLCK